LRKKRKREKEELIFTAATVYLSPPIIYFEIF
jgi:hypothetical protein